LKESIHSHENIEKIFNKDRDKENCDSKAKTDFSTNANTNRTNDNEFNSNQIDGYNAYDLKINDDEDKKVDKFHSFESIR